MSSGIEGRIDGVKEVMNALSGLGPLAHDALKAAITKAVIDVHGAAVKSITSHRSVKAVETRYNPKRTVEVSADGETPNSDRGTLARSIQFDVDDETLVGTVGTNLDYGLHLELGTTQVNARPWLYPAFEDHKAEIIENISEFIQIAIRSRSA